MVAPREPEPEPEREIAARDCSTWGPDPDRYIRPVKGGRYQARPHNSFTGERDNLGTFATRAQARVAIRDYWAGRRKPKPKFVRSCPCPGASEARRYFVVLPAPTAEGGRKWQRVGRWYDTEEEAAAAVVGCLRAAFGPHAATAMLSRRDTSARRKRGG